MPFTKGKTLIINLFVLLMTSRPTVIAKIIVMARISRDEKRDHCIEKVVKS